MTRKGITVEEQVNAATQTIGGDAVWDLLESADRVVVASGKKTAEFFPASDKEEIVAKACGRTGNLRAPTLRSGNTFFVGFNEEMYSQWIR